eukprot:2754825-Prymnesium_polylepis.2
MSESIVEDKRSARLYLKFEARWLSLFNFSDFILTPHLTCRLTILEASIQKWLLSASISEI